MSDPRCDPRFDARLVAQSQLARFGNGQKIQEVIRRYPDDESKVWVLSVEGYVLFDKEDIANAYVGYMRSDS